MKYIFNIILLLLLALPMTAQERNTQLTIVVSSVEGDNLKGQTIVLEQTDYQVKYGELFLNAEGKCVLKVYPVTIF
jgi:hypothetical protein